MLLILYIIHVLKVRFCYKASVQGFLYTKSSSDNIGNVTCMHTVTEIDYRVVEFVVYVYS